MHQIRGEERTPETILEQVDNGLSFFLPINLPVVLLASTKEGTVAVGCHGVRCQCTNIVNP